VEQDFLLFGALRDAGPDSWGRRVIEKHAGVAKFGELDYLLESPDDRAGALGSSFRIQLALWSPDVSSHAAHPTSPLAPRILCIGSRTDSFDRHKIDYSLVPA
jgi:hypothetical protein